MKRKLLLFLGASLCAFGIYSCQKNIRESSRAELDIPSVAGGKQHKSFAAGNKRVDTVQKGFRFTEGPAVDKEGNVFFTDQPDDRIYKWNSVTNEITLFLQGTGRSNGMAFDKDGNLIACADMHGELWKIFPDGSHEVLVDNYQGKLLNGPNDVWINPVTGGIYITDPMFPRSYWDDTDPRKINNPGWPPQWSDQGAGRAGHVYYLAPGSNTLVRVTTMMGWNPETSWPNGVVGTPDGKKLYVNKWNGDLGGTFLFDINPDGTLSNMQKISKWGGDGMSMDELGNIYISNGRGVMVLGPAGDSLTTIATGGGATNNVFAGKNEKVLFITGGGPTSPPFPNNQDRVMTVQMNVRGVEKFD